jgi:hypothetical protein
MVLSQNHGVLEPPPLHFILRYSDGLRRVDTLAEHHAIARQYGYVWWGKFGVGIARPYVEIANRQIAAGITTQVFLAATRKILHQAELLEVLGGGARTKYRPKERSKIPKYYRDEECTLWFKLTRMRDVDVDDLRRLRQYNAPSFAPPINGMSGLLYVCMTSEASPRLL